MKKIYRLLISYLENLSFVINDCKDWIGEWLDIFILSKKFPMKGFRLTKQEKREIGEQWKQYGKKIPLIWHKKYYSFSGKLALDFFPEYLYTTKLDSIMNPPMYARVLSDKNLLTYIYKFAEDTCDYLKIPDSICSCSNGNYYLYDKGARKSEIIDFLLNVKDSFIIKPAVGESSGRGVKIISGFSDRNEVIDLLEKYADDFVIQECILQDESFSKLHPASVNTIRIMTYRLEDRVYHCPMMMRMGAGGSHLDNAHAGGLYISVSDDGELGKFAIQNNDNSFLQHPDTGIVFEGYKLNGINKIINAAKCLHVCLPMIGIVNWDLVLGKDGEVVLIEGNLSRGGIWAFQNVWGCGVFGSNTKKIIDIINNKKNNCH